MRCKSGSGWSTTQDTPLHSIHVLRLAMSLSRASRLKMDMRRSKRKKMGSRKRLLSEFLTPEDAITRYKRVLEAVNKGNNKTAAYRAVGVDRKTIADTAGIAELHAVNPGIFQDIRGTLKKGETLLRFSEMCKSAIKDHNLEGKVQDLKTNGGLLSINPKGK
ncbi:coiled-coil domain-containing protein 106-like isoform X2 [Trematomus bernacchii]|uniref:coiled-coil domain-containing protein 106-like isoform X2 n=1 Tax=Trematomus bernacchii TaxID=40690 RepID=UPI00146BE9BC|nr:coiled-coil domain-containing protein 106-like isoform X2 [Trematomus bernacchii]